MLRGVVLMSLFCSASFLQWQTKTQKAYLATRFTSYGNRLLQDRPQLKRPPTGQPADPLCSLI